MQKINADILDEAILFAATAHKGQKRKGNGQPYILHPMEVLQILRSIKKSNNAYLLGAVCMLHDVVEDCNVPIETISKKFGLHVAAMVEELTTDAALCKSMGKTEYLSQKMLHMSSYALRIKLADRLNNCQDLATMSKEFRDKYIPQTKAIISALESGRKLTKSHRELIRRIKQTLA